jgi:hypothetical protein
VADPDKSWVPARVLKCLVGDKALQSVRLLTALLTVKVALASASAGPPAGGSSLLRESDEPTSGMTGACLCRDCNPGGDACHWGQERSKVCMFRASQCAQQVPNSSSALRTRAPRGMTWMAMTCLRWWERSPGLATSPRCVSRRSSLPLDRECDPNEPSNVSERQLQDRLSHRTTEMNWGRMTQVRRHVH